MSQQEGIPKFGRQELRKATKFVEGDYSGINPRSFYRKLKRGIEEIQDARGFKYQTDGKQERDLDISSEEVGEKTGVVKGRMRATSDWIEVGNGALRYRPYGPHGALGIVLGLAIILVGLAGGEMAATAVGILVGLAGAYGYSQKEKQAFPIIRQDMIRVLMTGEVSERTTREDGQERTDIFANMSVVFAGDAFVAVDTSGLGELDWNFRRSLVTQVKKWHNEVVQSDREKLPIESGFMWQLKGWFDRDVSSHRGIIEGAQNALVREAPFEYRMRYTELLEEQLTPQMKDTLEEHRDDLMSELEEIAEDIEIYVEREGLQHTSKIDGSTGSDPQIGPGGDE